MSAGKGIALQPYAAIIKTLGITAGISQLSLLLEHDRRSCGAGVATGPD
jgi:hypothetical protein